MFIPEIESIFLYMYFVESYKEKLGSNFLGKDTYQLLVYTLCE